MSGELQLRACLSNSLSVALKGIEGIPDETLTGRERISFAITACSGCRMFSEFEMNKRIVEYKQ